MAIPFFVKQFLARTGFGRFLPMTQRLTHGCPEAIRYYSDRLLAAPVEPLLDTLAFPASLDVDCINLNQATPHFETARFASRVGIGTQSNPPASGLIELRQAIAEAEARRDKRSIDPHREVLVTHGATGAYTSVLDAFVNPGRAVVVFDPCSPMFPLGTTSRRAKLRRVPAWNDRGRLRFDPDQLSRALRGATLLVLADPSNPTGAILAEEDLELIAWAANRSDVLIHLDESFDRFRYDSTSNRLAALVYARNRTLSVGSLSARDGLTSTRVGWLTGPRHLVQGCTLAATLAAPFVPTICQQLALRALQTEEELFGPTLEEYRAKRRFTMDRLTAMGLEATPPAAGYFVWVPVANPDRTGRQFAEELLKSQGVLIGPGDVYGPSGKDFVRVSFAAEDGRLREGLKRLAAFVRSLRGEPVGVPPEAEASAPAAIEERSPVFSRT